jgi:MFS family permease
MTVLFTEAKERAKAFAVYGAIAGGGSAVGLLLGGVLTEYASWRWCLLVNIPIALVALALAIPLVPESKAHGDTKYDIPGAVVVTLGLASLVYGFTEAAKPDEGWGSGTTWAFIGAGLVLLVVFVVIQRRVRNPLLPLRIVLDRNRGGAYLTSMLVGAGLFGSFLFLTLYLQNVLGYKPLEAGFASLPVTVGVLVSAVLIKVNKDGLPATESVPMA